MSDGPIVRHRVAADEAGTRLDSVVGGLEVVGSRAEAQRLIDAGRVTLNEVPVAKRTLVSGGDLIEVRPAPRPASQLVPQDLALAVRYEDEWLMIVDKPAGVVTHPSRGHDSATLVHGLLAHGIRGGDEGRPGIVHRLDRDTSGLIVVARSERAHRKLQRMMADRTIDRRYRTLVHGQFPPALSIDRAIGRDRRNRLKMSTNSDTLRDARTHFRRLEAYPRHTLLEARLQTGRTHQIRVHLDVAGFPVVGDPTYGRRGDELGLGRQFLHAWQIAFTHPETGVDVVVESALPADLAAVIDVLEHERRGSR